CQQAGIYNVYGAVEWASNSSGSRYLGIRLNGSTIVAEHYIASSASVPTPTLSAGAQYNLAVGDYVELVVLQNSGGSLNIQADVNFSPEFMMARIDTGGTGAVYVPTVKTANYTILATDSMVVAGASSLTLTLPAASAY